MKENGFEYVNLGLPSGTMWATCNVGASKPEDDGLLFQFGRVDGYKYGDKNNQFKTKDKNKKDTGNEYTTLTTSGKIYKKNEILDLADDAAHVHMGGIWKMPTNVQLEELIDNTTHESKIINVVQGIMFTSKINNKQLFIPFAGWWYNSNFMWAGSYASVWSSMVHISNVNGAYRLVAYRFVCYSDDHVCIDIGYPHAAFSVRGVFKNNIN